MVIIRFFKLHTDPLSKQLKKDCFDLWQKLGTGSSDYRIPDFKKKISIRLGFIRPGRFTFGFFFLISFKVVVMHDAMEQWCK